MFKSDKFTKDVHVIVNNQSTKSTVKSVCFAFNIMPGARYIESYIR